MVNPSSSHTVNTTPTQNCAFSAAVSHVSFEAVRKPPEAAGKSCWIFTDIIPIVTCFYTHTVPSQRTQKALNIKIVWQTTGNISTPVTDSPLLVHHSSIVVCINELLGGFFELIGSIGSSQDHSNANSEVWWCFQSNIPLFILETHYIKLKLNDRIKWTHFHVAYMCLMLRCYVQTQKEHQLSLPPLHRTQLHKCVFIMERKPSLALVIVGLRSLHQSLVTDETMMMTLTSTVTVVWFKPGDKKKTG